MIKYFVIVLVLFFLGCSDNQGLNSGRNKTESTAQEETPDENVMANMRGQAGGGEEHPGAVLYLEYCAKCHSQPVSRAPHKSFLEMLSPDSIKQTMDEGVMQQMAKDLLPDERQQITNYLVGEGPKITHPVVMCEKGESDFDYNQAPRVSGWGMDENNSRFIPGEVSRLTPGEVKRLKLKWAFAYPGATRARSQPTLAGGAVIVGSQNGTVYSLDSDTGCVRWTFRASAEVRTGVTVTPWRSGEKTDGPVAGYFADILARIYAIDLVSGKLLWMTKVDEHPNATTTAQPILYGGRIYATVSSLEVVPAADPEYPCCNFRGSIVALNVDTGKILWKRHTIEEESIEAGVTSAGTKIFAPSGAPSWNSPTIDVKRQSLYFGTGENYSSPAQGSSDAIFSLDIESGEINWIRQVTQGDAWNVACMPFIPDKSNCPVENGPDVDFGAPPILFQYNDKELLVAGQKSGDVYGIRPDDGSIVWHQKLGRGSNQGGIHFGMASENDRVFVPMADYDDDMLPIEEAKPGITALDAFTGERIWNTPANNICNDRKDCDPGISAAVTAIPGIVFAGHMDGRLRAYDTRNGNVVWEFDTFRDFKTLSGEIAHGGSFGGGSGPVVENGKLYVNSGYGIYFHMPGNVLLVFETE